MKFKLFYAVLVVVAVALVDARTVADVDLINLLEGQRLEIVCPKYFEGNRAYDPLLKFKNSSSTGQQIQLAFGPNPRYDAPPSMKIIVNKEKNSFSYAFGPVDSSLAGEYSCGQKGLKDVVVTVFVNETLACPEVASSSVVENEFFSTSCGVSKYGQDDVVWPQDFFVLFKGDEVVEVESLDEGDRLTIRNVQNSRGSAPSLFMSREDHRDAVHLSCAIPSLGLRCDAPAPNVTWSPDPPTIEGIPSYLRKGASASLSCRVDDLGNPPMVLSVEDLAHPEAIFDAVVEGGRVDFSYNSANIVEIANASIRCSVGNISEEVSFLIAEGPDSVRPNREEISVDAGEVFGLSCEAVASNPEAVINYAINDEKIMEPEAIVARPEMDGGAVTCQARNPLTRVASPIAQVPIKVRYFVSEAETNRDQIGFRIGEDILLNCPFRGNPIPFFVWTFNSSLDSTSEDDEISSTSTVTINNASTADAGVYSCYASNDLGGGEFQIRLDVLVDPVDDSSGSFPMLDVIPATAVIIPIVIVVIILIAAVLAFILRRKAVAGKMDVEKGNKEIRDLPNRDEDESLLENDGHVCTGAGSSIADHASPTSPAEDESFIITETEPVTTEDGDVSRDENQEPSFDSQPPSELMPGDERL